MQLIKTIMTYDRRNVFVLGLMGLAVLVILFLLFSAFNLVSVRAQNNTNKDTNNTAISQQSKNNNNSFSFLTYREPDIGIKLKYPSNWIKEENGLERKMHSIARFFLMHTDVHDRTNTTFAELDIRIYTQNATTDILSEVKQINNHPSLVILKSYQNPALGFFVLSALDKKLGLDELQIWRVIPTKQILVEMLFVADPVDYSRYLAVDKKIMKSLEITY
jgi:hypothetical protein